MLGGEDYQMVAAGISWLLIELGPGTCHNYLFNLAGKRTRPRRHEDKGGAPTREFGPILPSDEADMCRFSGLKVFSEENLVKYRARKSQKRKTNCGCELHKSAKTQKRLRL